MSAQVYFASCDEKDGEQGVYTSNLTVGIETNKIIKKGEQVLVDYSTRFWSSEEDASDPCRVLVCLVFYSLCFCIMHVVQMTSTTDTT